MTKTQDAAVRNYLISLRDPAALRDDDAIADLQTKIEQTDDELRGAAVLLINPGRPSLVRCA